MASDNYRKVKEIWTNMNNSKIKQEGRGGKQFNISRGNPNYDAMFAMVLAAAESGRKVYLVERDQLVVQVRIKY